MSAPVVPPPAGTVPGLELLVGDAQARIQGVNGDALARAAAVRRPVPAVRSSREPEPPQSLREGYVQGDQLWHSHRPLRSSQLRTYRL